MKNEESFDCLSAIADSLHLIHEGIEVERQNKIAGALDTFELGFINLQDWAVAMLAISVKDIAGGVVHSRMNLTPELRRAVSKFYFRLGDWAKLSEVARMIRVRSNG